ncbi:MAG: hypothetical protein JW776_00280 [Candidatus Lokiarchaeota archaeon]|nr:hypothetical protein [Candidatus Lokiarchaeota archaeon]
MDLIDIFLEAAKSKKIFSFIGMAKNVGKTTTFNYIINHIKSKYALGLTSIGRDGEKKDILTEQPKPKIFVAPGNLIATAEESLLRSKFQKKILKTTNVSSALGKIVLAKSLSKGHIELSGPSIVKDLELVCNLLTDFGAELILIDGAFDRKSFASPLLAHATILATGAAVSHNMEEVVEETRFTIKKLTIPPLTNGNEIQKIKDIFKTSKAGIMEEDNTIISFDVSTALNATPLIISSLTSKSKYILIKGIVGSDLIQNLLKSNVDAENITIIAEDGTKIFTSQQILTQWYNKGGAIKVLDPINILAVTANPISPYGFQFNRKDFMTQLRSQLSLPVFDVLGGEL